LNLIWLNIQEVDQKITDTEPFKLVKTNLEGAKALIRTFTQVLYLVSRRLEPFMPQTSETIKEAVLANKKPENLFTRLN
jgi:methionyl-tRNA synthetase